MAGEIIRKGDPTSHGGVVIEGSLSDICHGKSIAFAGHMTSCPKCKGTFPILEGALATTFYGRGVALAGMKTACGAQLIATQFTDIVEYSPPSKTRSSRVTDSSGVEAAMRTDIASQSNPTEPFDMFFLVKDPSTGLPLPDTPYRITLTDGKELKGTTDCHGRTEKISSHTQQQATIEVPYYDHCDAHTAVQSESCGC